VTVQWAVASYNTYDQHFEQLVQGAWQARGSSVSCMQLCWLWQPAGQWQTLGDLTGHMVLRECLEVHHAPTYVYSTVSV